MRTTCSSQRCAHAQPRCCSSRLWLTLRRSRLQYRLSAAGVDELMREREAAGASVIVFNEDGSVSVRAPAVEAAELIDDTPWEARWGDDPAAAEIAMAAYAEEQEARLLAADRTLQASIARLREARYALDDEHVMFQFELGDDCDEVMHNIVAKRAEWAAVIAADKADKEAAHVAEGVAAVRFDDAGRFEDAD